MGKPNPLSNKKDAIYIDYVAPTTTTTPQPPQYADSPFLFAYPLSGVSCPIPQQDDCPCGSLLFPIGSKYASSGVRFRIISDSSFIDTTVDHDRETYIDYGQSFVTTTPKITQSISPKRFILYFDNYFAQIDPETNNDKCPLVNNTIQILIRNAQDNTIFANNVFGSFPNLIKPEFISSVNSYGFEFDSVASDDLINKNLIISISSLCDFQVNENKCDTLPSTITLENSITELECTTMPPCDFYLPDSFPIGIRGLGNFTGQTSYSTVNRISGTRRWEVAGSFACGANYFISMTCQGSYFTYDGYIDCCDQNSRIVLDQSTEPLLTPNTIVNSVVTYTRCDDCVQCTTTTTPAPTTTTTSTTTTQGPANGANFAGCANWNGSIFGNITTVGSNGGPSAYGTYDQTGNISEFLDVPYATTAYYLTSRPVRNGNYTSTETQIGSDNRRDISIGLKSSTIGFRIASKTNSLNLPDFVAVTDTNNAADTNGYGVVNEDYLIRKFPITNCEYIEFLRAVGSTGSEDLQRPIYVPEMATDYAGGIIRSGSLGAYTYSLKPNMGNKPVIYVSYYSAMRYCNWLHNNKPVGNFGLQETTESGAYFNTGGPYWLGDSYPKKADDAKYYIPLENEWYKAAYYKGGGTNAGYWKYATQSDNPPSCVTCDGAGNGPRSSAYISCQRPPPPPPTTTTVGPPPPPTTTTTTQPPIPCDPPDENIPTEPVVIQGYAFYKTSRGMTENIIGIGQLSAPCGGSHVCNRATFRPTLISDRGRLTSSLISLNNYPGGGNRSQTFSFTITDPSILKANPRFLLECASPNNDCHNNVTWVVLTATYNGKTSLLFNSCVTPGQLNNAGGGSNTTPIDVNCRTCCDWDGNGKLILKSQEACGIDINESLLFIETRPNVWEVTKFLECGDRFSMGITCDPNVSLPFLTTTTTTTPSPLSGTVVQNISSCANVTVQTITNTFSTSGVFAISGGVNDDILFNGSIYEPAQYPGYIGSSPCFPPGSNIGILNGAHNFNYTTVLSSGQSITIGVRDYGAGGGINASWSLTPIFTPFDTPPTDNQCTEKWKVLYATLPCATNFRTTGHLLSLCKCDEPPFFEFWADSVANCSCCGQGLIGFTHDIIPQSKLPDGYQGIYIDNPSKVFMCDLIITTRFGSCETNTSTTRLNINSSILAALQSWINNGGRYLYHGEYVADTEYKLGWTRDDCADINLTNSNMASLGSSLSLTTFGAGPAGGNINVTGDSLIPLVSGIQFTFNAVNKIVGGTNLITVPNGTIFPGSIRIDNQSLPYFRSGNTMSGQIIGNGIVILVGDSSYIGQTSDAELRKFFTRLITLQKNQIF